MTAHRTRWHQQCQQLIYHNTKQTFTSKFYRHGHAPLTAQCQDAISHNVITVVLKSFFKNFPGPGKFRKINQGLSRISHDAWKPWNSDIMPCPQNYHTYNSSLTVTFTQPISQSHSVGLQCSQAGSKSALQSSIMQDASNALLVITDCTLFNLQQGLHFKDEPHYW